MINFAFMPMWGRIPWVAGTSFIWSMILSLMRGGAVSEGDEFCLLKFEALTSSRLPKLATLLFKLPGRLFPWPIEIGLLLLDLLNASWLTGPAGLADLDFLPPRGASDLRENEKYRYYCASGGPGGLGIIRNIDIIALLGGRGLGDNDNYT